MARASRMKSFDRSYAFAQFSATALRICTVAILRQSLRAAANEPA
jgi:hypothetical protein